MQMVKDGNAYCVPGNHDMKLLRKLRGKDVQLTHGIAETLAQLEKETPEFRAEVQKFLDGLISHYVFDEGRLTVAHAGMKEEMQGRGSGKVRDFALFGETTGEVDEFGLQVRYNWAADYRGGAMVVYGHTPVPEAEWLNRNYQHRYGLCIWRKAERTTVSRERDCLCARAQDVLPACETVYRNRGTATNGATGTRRFARPGGCNGQAIHQYAPAGEHHHSARKCHGGVGGDEPIRGESEVADLLRQRCPQRKRARNRGCWSIQRKPLHIFGMKAFPQ